VIAEALGVVGAVLASAGTEAAPFRLTAPLEESASPRAPEAAPEAGDDTALHALLVVGAIVLVGAGVGIAAGVAANGEDGSEVQFTGPPVVRW